MNDTTERSLLFLIIGIIAAAIFFGKLREADDLRHEEQLYSAYRESYEAGFDDGYDACMDDRIEYIDRARASMKNALEITHGTLQYGGFYSFDDRCDDIVDEITDALAWLEKVDG